MSNYSPKLPLLINDSNGYENNQTIMAVINQNLKMILLTSPGERIMDPNFGVGMKRYLFEQNDSSTYSRIKAKIKRQVSQYMGYIKIEDVLFHSESNNDNITANGLLVTVKFSVNGSGAVSALVVNI
jgi:phage baseplate assembly protein W